MLAERPLDDETVVGVDERDDHGPTGGELLAQVLPEARIDLLLGEPAHEPTHRPTDDDGAEHRRVEEADEHADAATPPEALAPEMVGGVGHLHLPVGSVFDEDDAVGRDRPVGHECRQRIEVVLGRIDRRVGRHDQFE